MSGATVTPGDELLDYGPMDFFHSSVRGWFDASFEAPTRVQREGWPVLARGDHALLLAPTGSGKTLAAFLWAIDSSYPPRARRQARHPHTLPVAAQSARV